MKIVSFEIEDKRQWGIYDEEDNRVLTNSDTCRSFMTFQEVIDYFNTHNSVETLPQSLEWSKVKLMSPVIPTKDIMCIGKNYVDHIKEFDGSVDDLERVKEVPVFFTKAQSSIIPHGGTIMLHEGVTNSIDYEAELAIVIGKQGINIKKEEAFDYIYGYTILNDVSARDVQLSHQQWFKGKSLDTFCPIGPWVVTKDELSNPSDLKIQSVVDGELRQDSNTGLMIHPIDALVEWLSKGMTLNPGDVIATGTPSGVGMGFNPPRLLKSGSTVEIIVEGVGSLKNVVE